MKVIRKPLSLIGLFGLVISIALMTNISPAAACSALPSDKGQASYTVSIPTTGSYRVWSRIYSPSTDNNGFYMQVDQTYCSITVGDSSSIPVGTFTWVNYQNAQPANLITLSLSAGKHAVIIAGLDPSVGVDRMMFLTDFTCTPTGNGDNCVTLAAATTSTNPVVGVVNLKSDGSDSATSVDYTVDGKPVLSSTLDTTTLTDGKHTIVAVSHFADGSTKTISSVITTENFPTFWQFIRNLWNRYWWIIALVIIAAVTVFVIVNRRRIFASYYAFFHRVQFMLRDRRHITKSKMQSTPTVVSPYFDGSLNNKDKK